MGFDGHPKDRQGLECVRASAAFQRVPESGTVVPRSKTLRAPGGRAYDRLPSFASLIPKCHFDIHDAILAHRCCTKKPTVGFSARFFLEGPDRRLWLMNKDLRRKKPQKIGKARKKVSFSFARIPVFLQNSPKKGRFFLSTLRLKSTGHSVGRCGIGTCAGFSPGRFSMEKQVKTCWLPGRLCRGWG